MWLGVNGVHFAHRVSHFRRIPCIFFGIAFGWAIEFVAPASSLQRGAVWQAVPND